MGSIPTAPTITIAMMKKNPKELYKGVSLSIFYAALFFAAIALVSTKGLSDEKEVGKLFSITSDLYTIEHFKDMCIVLLAVSGGLCLYQRIASSCGIKIALIDNFFESMIKEFHHNVIHFGGALTGVAAIAMCAAYLKADNDKVILFCIAALLLFVSFSGYGFLSGLVLGGNEKAKNPRHDDNAD